MDVVQVIMLHKAFAGLTLLVAVAAPSTVRSQVALPVTSATPTTPPEIVHVVSHELCTALHKRIGPAIGMLLQNDQTIARSPALFTAYNKAAGTHSEGTRNIALLRMENLVGPIADNIIAIKNQLSDPQLFPEHPQSDGQVQALKLRNGLLFALGPQETSLDIINGFVETQNLADLQHRDEGLIRSLSQPDAGNQSTPTPNPFIDPNQAGLAGIEPPDPGYINPATIPGLNVGYNTTTRLRDALETLRKETTQREDSAASAVTQAIAACGGHVTAPSPTSTP